MSFVDAAELERFRALVARRLGLAFDETKLPFLREVLQRRVSASGGRSQRYLDRLEWDDDSTEGELTALVRELTVGETYFFRHREQMRAFAEVALPDRVTVRGSARKLRLLSAGCASGEEAYTLAMLVRSVIPDAASWDIDIVGADINLPSLERARSATYSLWSLRETPPEARERWFTAERGGELKLLPEIRTSVRFEQTNLIANDPQLWQSEHYDVVFCRNVLMYFTSDHAREVVARIARSLAPGGYLFMGHAETLRGLSDAFKLLHTHDTFFYQRKEGASGSVPSPVTSAPSAWLASETPRGRLALGDTAWIGAIQAASDRIKALSVAPVEVAPPTEARPLETFCDLSAVYELLRQERFADALEVLSRQPPEHPDVLLLRSLLLCLSSRFEEAEASAQILLGRGERMAGAHYVMALSREAVDDRGAAMAHHRAACYQDPRFAMPRLHLGLLARRSDDRVTGRRELSLALQLLEHEESRRLLLFGGGFSREALMMLCRTELAACGGAR